MLQPVRSLWQPLHRDCLWVQQVPRGKRVSLHLQFTLTHWLPCTHGKMFSAHQCNHYTDVKKKKYILSSFTFPSHSLTLVVSWLNVSIEEYLNHCTTVYKHHCRAHAVHPASHCALLFCHSMSLLGNCRTGVHIIIFLQLYELQPV